MKKLLFTVLSVVTFFCLGAASASAFEEGVVKVGLRFGSTALDSANLENAVGSGYAFGYLEEDRTFQPLAWTEETQITMSPAGHGIEVTATRTGEVLYQWDEDTLAVQPQGEDAVTWFKGYRYAGAFEYTLSGGGLQVVNVVDLEDYVKGVVPHEMGGDWPAEALAAQAVCARTFACGTTKHRALYGFDVCNGNDCQVYNGVSASTAATDRAVEETEGECLYYGGDLVRDALYHASDGGATEDSANVFGGAKGYLIGKEDPYETPSTPWSVTYTAEELTWILAQKDYDIGEVRDVYISQTTPMGNVREVTFVGSRGNAAVSGLTCSSIFYSSTYKKSVPSLRFTIQGGSGGGGVYVNGGERIDGLDGAAVLSGRGTLGTLEGSSFTAVSASGAEMVSGGGSASGFTITGTGSGHQVGMSQRGAKAMAEAGYDYREILEFYYTDITVE